MFLCLAPRSLSAKIRLDVSEVAGPVPELLSASVWLQFLRREDLYALTKLFDENRPRVIQLSVVLLQGSTSLEDYQSTFDAYLDEEAPTLLLTRAKALSTRIIIGFDPCPMPSWLSSNPGNRAPASNLGYTIESCSPPNNRQLWQQVVTSTLQAFRDRGVTKLGLYVGHEQERDWIGDEQSFFSYYEASARAAKALDKTIVVGGPGSAGWIVARHGCALYAPGAPESRALCEADGGWSDPQGESFIKNFIDYAATNGQGTTRVPLDFINWHHFAHRIHSFEEGATQIRTWLAEDGLEGVELFPGDWTVWASPPYPADYLDTAEYASYIPQALQAMWTAGIRWQGHDFNVFSAVDEASFIAQRDQANGGVFGTFIGDWALFTRHGDAPGGIVKPAYNAFKLLSLMVGDDPSRQMLQPAFSGLDGTSALATTDGARVYLLLSRSVPQGTRFSAFLLGRFFQSMGSLGLDTEVNWLRDRMKEYKNGTDPLTAPGSDLEKELLQYLLGVSRCIQTESASPACEASVAQKLVDPVARKIRAQIQEIFEPTSEVTVVFDHLQATGEASLVSFTMDNMHSNACTYNNGMKPPPEIGPPCSVGGPLDLAIGEALQAATRAGKVSIGDVLGAGFPDTTVQEMIRAFETCTTGGRNAKDCLGLGIARIVRACMVPGVLLADCLPASLVPTVERCMNGGESKQNCLQQSLTALGRKVAEAYRTAWHDVYTPRIDALNDLPEIAIEGSRKESKVPIDDGEARIVLTLERNAVVLLVLDSGGTPTTPTTPTGCGGCAGEGSPGATTGWLLLGVLVLFRLRRPLNARKKAHDRQG